MSQDPRSIADTMIGALTPSFISDDVSFLLTLCPHEDEITLEECEGLTQHGRLAVEGGARKLLAHMQQSPAITQVRPRLEFILDGPRHSAFAFYMSTCEWNGPFGNIAETLAQLLSRLQAVDAHVDSAGDEQIYVVAHGKGGKARFKTRARNPRQAAYLFAACQSPTAGLRQAFHDIQDILIEAPRKSWTLT